MQPEAGTARIDGGRLGVGQVQRVLTLRTFPAYRNMSPEQLAVVAEYTRERFFAAGEHLQVEGRPVTTLHFVISGEVELYRGGRALRRMGPKTVVGGLAAFARASNGYDVVALEDTVTLEINAEDTRDIFEDHFPLLRAVINGLAREVLSTRKKAGPHAGYSNEVAEDCPCPPRPLDLVERMARLRDSIFTSRLDAIAEIAREAVEERVEAGEYLWHEGEPSGFYYVMVAGRVECRSEETGQTFRFGSGDAVGVLDAAAGDPRWYDARVASDMVALRIDIETLFDIFEDQFDLAMDLVALMAGAILRFYDDQARLSAVPDEAGLSEDDGGS